MAALRYRGATIAALVMMIVSSGCSSSGASSQSFGSALTGTAWIAEDLGGRGVLDHPQTTLSFPQAGQVGGSGGCNHYGGPVDITGESIRFGLLASTSIACSPPIGDQEKRFFAALRSATRFVVTAEDKLVLYDATGEAVVTFSRAEP